MPILKAIAVGAKDERIEVKNESLQYLATTLTDPHATVVPAGLLINILSDIFLPACINGIYKWGDESKSVSDELLNVNKDAMTKCFTVLLAVLSENAGKIIHYPTFDKLWINLLSVYGEVKEYKAVLSNPVLIEQYKQYFATIFQLFRNLGIFAEKQELLRFTEACIREELSN